MRITKRQLRNIIREAIAGPRGQSNVLLDKESLKAALQSQIEGGRIGDVWTYPGSKGSVTFMYDKKRGQPYINQGIKVKFSFNSSDDPSQWTMTANAWINEKAPASSILQKTGYYTRDWNEKMPQGHPLASGETMHCSFEAIVDLFNEFKDLCDDVNPDTAR